MITTELYRGQGLGNQLWCYTTARVIAKKHGYKFGIQSPENFKGADFLDIDFGEKVVGGSGPDGGPPEKLPEEIKYYYKEKSIIHPLNGTDIRLSDDDLLNIKDGTKIDGLMQDEQYIVDNKEEIKQWLKVREEFECFDFSSDDICVINFRGGYAQVVDLFLPKEYWVNAMRNMRQINPNFRFVVITEDVKTARRFFPKLEIFHFSIAKDYVIIKNAKYLILSNSSFAWFPAWLNEKLQYCIAPKYWARHNVSDGYWSLGYNITTGWMHQDRLGNLQNYQTCRKELDEYIKNNKATFSNSGPFKPSFSAGIKDHIRIFNAFKKESSMIIAFSSITKFVMQKIYIETRAKMGRIKLKIKNSQFIKTSKREAKKIIYSSKNTFKRIKWRVAEYQAKKKWLSPAEIKEYRKTIKIYDAFNFFNELDLLEIRLNILNNYVDYFVIVESTLTHSGQPKELFFEKNKERFKKFEHKIIHYTISNPLKNFDDAKKRLENPTTSTIEKEILKAALTSDNICPGSNDFLRDFYEKESVKIPLQSLSDNDFCFVSDLDEIWNPELIIDYSQDDIFKPLLDNYVYFLNNRSNEIEGGTGTIGTKYKNIKDDCLGHLRSTRKTRYTRLLKGGWHFTFQGKIDMIRKKLEAYSYQGPVNLKARSKINKKIDNNEDIFGRHFTFWKDESKLPKYILDNRKKYKYLLK